MTPSEVKIGELYICHYILTTPIFECTVLILNKYIQEFETEVCELVDFWFLDEMKISTYFLDKLGESYDLTPLEDDGQT